MPKLDETDAIKNMLQRHCEAFMIKNKLQTQIGRAIVAHSAVEYMLLILLQVLSEPLTDEEVTSIYKGLGTFKNRMILIDYVVRTKCNKTEKKRWIELRKDLEENAIVRNNAAHYNLTLAFDEDRNPLGVSLARPPFSAYGKKIETVEQEEIEMAGNALEKARYTIELLAVDIHKRIHPDKDLVIA